MERIGFVGLGTMGASMAANLAAGRGAADRLEPDAGPGRALVEMGAREAASPARLAARSDVVVVCVSDTPDVEAVLFGPGGIAEGAAPDSLVIDCSTISPGATREFGRRLAERGVGHGRRPGFGRLGRGAARHAHDLRRRRAKRTSLAPGRSWRRSAGRSPTWGRSAAARPPRPSTR